MKVIKIRKKHLLLFAFLFITIEFFFFGSKISLAMQHYYKLDFSTGLVTASTLNVRSGPSTKYPVVTTVKKNEYIRVFAGIGDWYVIQTDTDHVGAVSKQYVKAIYPSSNNTGNSTGNNTNQTSLTSDEQEVFNLINAQRTKNGLTALKIDNEVQRVARIKAQDMVDNNYFSHNSPIYGSPFDMLKSFKISYKTAGENIAGNSSNTAAVNAWMNSSGHKANILNSNYNYTGIGVVKSPKYGKMYVQMFIGK
ncbi:MAG: SH3 domain-containing protein [Clostridia bacterium]|nr:SH3 domain-containing protein [Clostridia bacterium]